MQFIVEDTARLGSEGDKQSTLSYWAYKIVATVTLPSYQEPPLFDVTSSTPPSNFVNNGGSVSFCTWHRYSDFEWFVKYLENHYPGVVLPPIPPKEVHGSTAKLEDAFNSATGHEDRHEVPLVGKRMRRLQLFLDYFAHITDVHETDVVKAFFTMEAPQFFVYKKNETPEFHVQDEVKRLVARASKFFKRLIHKRQEPVIFMPDSEPAKIRDFLSLHGSSLMEALVAALELVKHINVPSTRNDAIDEIHSRIRTREILLPSTFYDHVVYADNKIGTVRHIEGSTVWVEDSEGNLNYYDYRDVSIGPDGISDPAVLACQEFVHQIDSFLTYISLNKAATDAKIISDDLWFWGTFCGKLVDQVHRIGRMEKASIRAREDAEEAKENDVKESLMTQSQEMHTQFEQCLELFYLHYRAFLPRLRDTLQKVAVLWGSATSQVMLDTEWLTRLAPADGFLKLRFEIPEQVRSDVTHIYNAALEEVDTVSSSSSPASLKKSSSKGSMKSSKASMASYAPPPQQKGPDDAPVKSAADDAPVQGVASTASSSVPSSLPSSSKPEPELPPAAEAATDD